MRSANSPSRYLAAIDLGSNSFHLVVAKFQQQTLHIKAKHRAKTELAANINDNGYLNLNALHAAYDCLAHFGTVLKQTSPVLVRALGTKTLRDARNLQDFLHRAEALLGYPIEVISGREEARLIYLGAAKAIPAHFTSHFVVDIGGGSTEIILGEQQLPQQLNSLTMGCVTFKRRFFSHNRITHEAMNRAQAAAFAKLLPLREQYTQTPWQVAVASSGTAQTVISVLTAMGLASQDLITHEALLRLRKRLIQEEDLNTLALPGLAPERAAILPAGVAILCAIFSAFKLNEVHYVKGALREGILYDLHQRLDKADPRYESITHLCERFDLTATPELWCTAKRHLQALAPEWHFTQEQHQFLDWAMQLSQLGTTVAQHHYQRHGAYFLRAVDLAGFSQQEQQILAFLVEAHRGEFPLNAWQQLPSSQQTLWGQLALIFRFAQLERQARGYYEAIGISALSKTQLHVDITAPATAACDTHALWEQLLANENHALRHTPFRFSYTICQGAEPRASHK